MTILHILTFISSKQRQEKEDTAEYVKLIWITCIDLHSSFS